MSTRNNQWRGPMAGAVLSMAGIAALAAQTPPAPEPASLSGIVTNTVTAAPVLRAHVTLRSYDQSSRQLYGAMTTGEGKFSITKLPPGRYTVSVERTGFVMPSKQPASATDLTLSPGDKKENFALTLTPCGAIGGRVLDAAGEPMQGISVTAEGPMVSDGVTTDDLGHFRIGGLQPGKYRVRAAPPAVMFLQLPRETRTDGASDVHYSPTYYPEALDGKQGARIDVQPAAELGGIDIRLAPTPIVSVTGRVAGLPPGVRIPIEAQPSNAGDGSQAVSDVKADGTFTFWRLDLGRYTLVAVVGPNGLASVPVDVEVAGVNIEHVEVRVMPPFDIPIQLLLEDQQAVQQQQPAPLRRLSLRSVTVGRFSSPPSADIGADDTLTLERVEPGIYRVFLSWRPAAYIKSIRVGSAETEGSFLDVRNGLAGAVTMVVSTNTCQVHGTVSSRSGPVAGVRVVMAQPVETGRPNPYITATTAADGSYTFAGLAPGKYELLAADDGALEAIQRGQNPEDYEDITESLELHPGDKISKDLKTR